MRGSWWWDLLAGLVYVVLGALLLFWPEATLLVVAVLIGLYLLVAGGVRIGMAIWDKALEARGYMVLVGIAGFVLGLLILRDPERSLELAIILLAIYWVLSGLMDIFRSDTAPAGQSGSQVLGGIIALVAGVVLLFWPDITLRVVTLVAGLAFAALGVVVAGFALAERFSSSSEEPSATT